MSEEQDDLARWSEDALFGTLREESLYDLHVGVVSADIGAGPYGIMGCTGNGDDGVFQSGAGCASGDPFLVDEAAEDGSRVQNYEGSIAEAFSCMAVLGTAACGFEQPLESMRRALDGRHASQNSFLRSDAILAVVFITDEDDCSAENTYVYESNPALDNLDSELGPLASFRCFEHGVICEDDEPRSLGVKSACEVRENSLYMASVQEYAEFLKTLKGDPGMVVVGGIVGNTNLIDVFSRDGEPALSNSCSEDQDNIATPAVRMTSFLKSFPARNAMADMCDGVKRAPLRHIAQRIAGAAAQSPCVSGFISDVDPGLPGLQSDCEASMEIDGEVHSLPSCSGNPEETGCFEFVTDTDQCSGYFLDLALRVRGELPANARLSAACR
jgi:hypothetical protein